MKNKIFSFFAIIALLFAFSCKKEMENSERWQNLPEIKMLDAASTSDNTIRLQGKVSHSSSNCEYFFLCSLDGKTFSKSEIKAEYDSKKGKYTGVYVPSADGTYYFKFCAVSIGRYSYIESEVLPFEYKPIDFSLPVDMGLPSGIMWASCNVGAKTPWEYGGYYQWAGTEDVTSTSIDLNWSNCPYHTGKTETKNWAKYNSNPSYGTVDNKSVLDLSDDIAHVQLGEKWRMPTDAEWEELIKNCVWTLTTLGGSKGYNVTSPKTGNSIFIPAAGYRVDAERAYAGSGGYYWSSTLSTSGPYYACGVYFYSEELERYAKGLRYYGKSVRPVMDNSIVQVTGIMVTPESAEIEAGKTLQLTATVLPENASEKSVTWSSDDESVATVSADGLVTAFSEGSVVITATTTDGGKTSICKLTVTPRPQVSEAVNLGLSVKWATCNVGASKPEEYGGYYQWAGTKDVTSTSINLDWDNCPYHTGTSSDSGWTKYSYSDKKEVLDPEDDVAHIKLGEKWRMPTDEEWKELIDNCTWTWTTQNKVHGCKVTSNVKGYTDKSIFLPACGCRFNTWLEYNDFSGAVESKISGYYWSSTRSKEMYGRDMFFNSTEINRSDSARRYYGQSIRPVYDDIVPVTDVEVTPGSATIEAWKTLQLTATVLPENASDKRVTWSSDDKSVAIVNADGLVTAVSEGSVVITATTTDGGKTSICKLMVTPMSDDVVDLGLPSGIKWASCNVGAKTPLESGGYYQWAGTEDVTSTSIYLDWSNCPYHTGSNSSTGWTKYNSNSSYGTVDNKSVLDLSDDVAHVQLGGKWRMPTGVEWGELIQNCTWTWISSVNGYKVTSQKTDNSIFLPAAGLRSDNALRNSSYGYYWSSSLDKSDQYALGVYVYSKEHYTSTFQRYCGITVRPVMDDSIVPVTGVDVAPGSATIEAGKTLQLTATVLPENASDKSVTWSSLNTKVATVSADGLVTAVSEGSALIYAITTDGKKENYCKLTVTPAQQISGAVDMGLSVKWATCNVGASKPEEYGGYYQWAGTQDVTSTSINLDWSNCPYHTGSDQTTGWTKYSYSDKEVLDPEDDVAHVKLGGNWRMPTDTEWKELIDNCTWTWTTQNKVHGYKVTSNIKGYTDKSIFLPACGYRNGTSLLYNDLNGDDESKIEGSYWSSTRSKEMYGMSMKFNSTSFKRYDRNRYYGCSIRPVCDK